MPSRENRIQRLEKEVKRFESELTKLRIRHVEIAQQFAIVVEQTKKLTHLFAQLHPIIAKMIGGYIVLEKKGLVTNDNIEAITQEEADGFIAKANPVFAQQVQSESNSARPVENNSGDSRARLSGAESVREPVPSSTADEQRQGNIVSINEGVREANGGDNKSPDIGTPLPTNVSP